MNRKRLICSLFLAGVLLMVLIGCSNGVRGTGSMVAHDFMVEDFNSLDIRGGYQVIWRESDSISVTVEMQENLFEFLQVSVTDDTLYVNSTRHFRLTNNRTPRVYIYIKLARKPLPSYGVYESPMVLKIQY